MLLRGEVVISGSCVGDDKLDGFLNLTSHAHTHTHTRRTEQRDAVRYAFLEVFFLLSVNAGSPL